MDSETHVDSPLGGLHSTRFLWGSSLRQCGYGGYGACSTENGAIDGAQMNLHGSTAVSDTSLAPPPAALGRQPTATAPRTLKIPVVTEGAEPTALDGKAVLVKWECLLGVLLFSPFSTKGGEPKASLDGTFDPTNCSRMGGSFILSRTFHSNLYLLLRCLEVFLLASPKNAARSARQGLSLSETPLVCGPRDRPFTAKIVFLGTQKPLKEREGRGRANRPDGPFSEVGAPVLSDRGVFRPPSLLMSPRPSGDEVVPPLGPRCRAATWRLCALDRRPGQVPHGEDGLADGGD